MRIAHALAAAAFVCLATTPGVAVDLAKIERTIAKEPAYMSKPKYCLLVFGPEAKTRVWLALDGETLYLDRNGNGDLTEKHEKVVLNEGQFPVGEIADAVGKTKYKVRSFNSSGYLLLDVDDRLRQECRMGFADRPQDAPIVHFNGPLQLEVSGLENPETVMPVTALTRGDRPSELKAFLVTRGLGKGKGSTVLTYHEKVPADVHPVAELEFSSKNRGDSPIKARYVLDQRC